MENENHCDFIKLREMLLRTNMEDMRETTHVRHYELYRRCKLQEMGFSDGDSMSLQETYKQRRQEHLAELQRKEEEMRQMFVVRVKEKEAELKEAEKEVRGSIGDRGVWSTVYDWSLVVSVACQVRESEENAQHGEDQVGHQEAAVGG